MLTKKEHYKLAMIKLKLERSLEVLERIKDRYANADLYNYVRRTSRSILKDSIENPNLILVKRSTIILDLVEKAYLNRRNKNKANTIIDIVIKEVEYTLREFVDNKIEKTWK